MSAPYTTRQFQATDWRQYKAIRLEALKAEPAVFASSYAEQLLFPDEYWQNRLCDNNCAYFGLYLGDELIGMSGIMCDAHHDREAELIASYIRKEYRGMDVAQLFYKARIEWARKTGIKRLIISHRESNAASRKANQRAGFQYTHRVSRLWHDGEWEDNLYYELLL